MVLNLQGWRIERGTYLLFTLLKYHLSILHWHLSIFSLANLSISEWNQINGRDTFVSSPVSFSTSLRPIEEGNPWRPLQKKTKKVPSLLYATSLPGCQTLYVSSIVLSFSYLVECKLLQANLPKLYTLDLPRLREHPGLKVWQHQILYFEHLDVLEVYRCKLIIVMLCKMKPAYNVQGDQKKLWIVIFSDGRRDRWTQFCLSEIFQY